MFSFGLAIILLMGSAHCAPTLMDKGKDEGFVAKLAESGEPLSGSGIKTLNVMPSESPNDLTLKNAFETKRLKREGIFDPVFNIPISILKSVNEHVNTKGTGNHDTAFAIPITALNAVNDLLNKAAGSLPIPSK